MATDLVERLQASVDEAAKHVVSKHAVFVLVSLYFLITVAATTHEQLLRAEESNLPLPLLGVGLPLVKFYIWMPLLYVLLHGHLILQFYIIRLKLQDLGDKVPDEKPIERRLQFPLPFCHWYLRTADSIHAKFLIRASTWLTVDILPIIILAYTQIKFLPYHNRSVTLWHQTCVGLDLAMLLLVLYGHHFGALFHTTRKLEALSRLRATIVPILIASVALFVIRVPKDARAENAWCCKWIQCNLDLSGGLTLVAEPPSTELLALAAHRGAGPDVVEDVWIKHAKGLDLRGRDLRGADFSGAKLYNVKFLDKDKYDNEGRWRQRRVRPADVDRVRKAYDVADLQHVNFRRANLSGAVLWNMDLKGIDFAYAKLQGTDLGNAQLDGADLRYTQLDDANLDYASLSGVVLERARLRGASLVATTLTGANLRKALMHGAILRGALLFAADIEETDLSGADLSAARFDGATITKAKFRGALLRMASLNGANTWRREGGIGLGHPPELIGVDLFGADLGAINLDQTVMILCDLRRVTFADLQGNPNEWNEIIARTEKCANDTLGIAATARIQEAVTRLKEVVIRLARTSRPLPVELPESVRQYSNLVGTETVAKFDEDLAEGLADLACENRWIANSMVDRARQYILIQGTCNRGYAIARRLLEHVNNDECAVGTTIPAPLLKQLVADARQACDEL